MVGCAKEIATQQHPRTSNRTQESEFVGRLGRIARQVRDVSAAERHSTFLAELRCVVRDLIVSCEVFTSACVGDLVVVRVCAIAVSTPAVPD
jgi:hypothetical protein